MSKKMLSVCSYTTSPFSQYIFKDSISLGIPSPVYLGVFTQTKHVLPGLKPLDQTNVWPRG